MIYFLAIKTGKYSDPISPSDSINSMDMSLMLLLLLILYYLHRIPKRGDGFGSGDLYISIKDSKVSDKSKNLGAEINSHTNGYCPFVDAQTNTLYFTSKRSEINNLNAGFSSFQEFLNDIC